MLPVPFFLVDSFTTTRSAGNPAGVVFTESPLHETQMLMLAAELNLETAFVSPRGGSRADYVVSYYTAVKRIPLCGHDTIALVNVLVQTGRLAAPGTVHLSTDVGILEAHVNGDGKVTMEQARPRYGQVLEAKNVAEALGLPLGEITATNLPVQTVSTGTPFVIVPVAHRAALTALAPDMAALVAVGESLPDDADGFYLWTTETESAGAQIHARCFAPAGGLPEDPVTGTASGAVGAYLAHHGVFRPDDDGTVRFRTEQGYAMGRPGHVDVCLGMHGREIIRVQVSGDAVIVGEGKMFL